MDLSKRKWEALYRDNGKFFTGYAGMSNDLKAGEHRQVTVEVKPAGFGRGRSSATFDFKDEDGHIYSMTCKGTSKLFDMIVNQEIAIEDGFFVMDIVQVKQGQNYAVEPVSKGD